MVVNKAPNGEAEPFFDRTRHVWVAPGASPTDASVARQARPGRSPLPPAIAT